MTQPIAQTRPVFPLWLTAAVVVGWLALMACITQFVGVITFL